MNPHHYIKTRYGFLFLGCVFAAPWIHQEQDGTVESFSKNDVLDLLAEEVLERLLALEAQHQGAEPRERLFELRQHSKRNYARPAIRMG